MYLIDTRKYDDSFLLAKILEKLDITDEEKKKLFKHFEKPEVVDAEPVKHGRWIGESQTKWEKLFFSQRVFKCSVCGNYLDFDGVNVGRGSANFCPNCGAKMDGESKEDD